jgi:4-amino-4-deoxychorismate lyase
MPHTLCIETIAVENRRFKNLGYHQKRLNKTRRELWGYKDDWDLAELIEIPEAITAQLHKCRLSYGKEPNEIKWEPYTQRTIRTVQRVYHDSVDYTYKYDQRPELNVLFAQRKDADEILIIKKGMVTDAFYCNVAFFDGSSWFTPDTYLLPGTQRAFLLDSGMIRETSISEKDISGYSHIRLFNAMMEWEKAPVLEISAIL